MITDEASIIALQQMVALIGMLLLAPSGRKLNVPSYRDLVGICGARA
jgi:hypothetical protein